MFRNLRRNSIPSHIGRPEGGNQRARRRSARHSVSDSASYRNHGRADQQKIHGNLIARIQPQALCLPKVAGGWIKLGRIGVSGVGDGGHFDFYWFAPIVRCVLERVYAFYDGGQRREGFGFVLHYDVVLSGMKPGNAVLSAIIGHCLPGNAQIHLAKAHLDCKQPDFRVLHWIAVFIQHFAAHDRGRHQPYRQILNVSADGNFELWLIFALRSSEKNPWRSAISL